VVLGAAVVLLGAGVELVLALGLGLGLLCDGLELLVGVRCPADVDAAAGCGEEFPPRHT
jgi:hypothetical protein